MDRLTTQNRIRGLAASAALMTLLIAGGCKPAATTRSTSEPTSVVVTRRDIVGLLPLEGKVIAPPNSEANAYSRYRAPVDRVLVSVGSKVRRGQVLVTLNFASAQAALEQAKSSLQYAQTEYNRARAEYDPQLSSLKAEYDAARAAERAAREADPSVQPPPDLEQLKASRIAAEQAWLRAKADRDGALLPYTQALEAANEYFRDAKAGAKLASIRAPISGTVTELNAKAGIETDPNSKQPIAKVVDLDALQVQADLTPDQVGFVKEGMDVQITFQGIEGKVINGKVVRIITTSPPNSTVQHAIVVNFDNEGDLVRPDTGVKTMGIRIGEVKDVVAVPNEAIGTDSSGKPVVNVLKPGGWEVVAVERGLSDGIYSEIRSGLSEKDTVQVPYRANPVTL